MIDTTQREQLSALADGQLQGPELAQALALADDEEGRTTWALYQIVGDVLRAPDLAPQTDHSAFLHRLRQQLAQEPPLTAAVPATVSPAPSLVAIAPPSVHTESANDPIFRWKLVAGLASVAAIGAIAWNTWSVGATAPLPSAQMALVTPVAPISAASSAPQQAQHLQTAQAPASAPMMIRDPRLDELLAAHKQFSGATALQQPAGFLRNATFATPSR